MPDRAALNRINAQHSTGPRTQAGKLRSSLNALTHGLTGCTVLLPTEDPADHQRHVQEFFDQYKPQGPTEKQLVQELVDTSWRLNRVPALEAEALSRAANPPTPEAAIAFDIVDAHHAIDKLALYSHRLSRQFHKTLDQLRNIQAERRETETRDLKHAAALLEMHKAKGIPYDPAEDGFVFSKDQIETFSHRLIRLNESRHIEHIRFYAASLAHPASYNLPPETPAHNPPPASGLY
jgi:hypothetical protein